MVLYLLLSTCYINLAHSREDSGTFRCIASSFIVYLKAPHSFPLVDNDPMIIISETLKL